MLSSPHAVPALAPALAPRSPAALVAAAAHGDARAWDAIVTRFTPLVRAIGRAHRLCPDDVDDVAQTTWLRLLDHVGGLKAPEALAGWIATTARRECIRVATAAIRTLPLDDEQLDGAPDGACVHERAVAAERESAVRRAVDGLPEHQRRLMRALLAAPAQSYEALAAELKMPVGSIGPTRARCLARLRDAGPLARVVAGA